METKSEDLKKIGHHTMNLYQIEMNELKQRSILIEKLIPKTGAISPFKLTALNIKVVDENVLLRIRLENSQDAKVGVLNFASPVVPGGNFLEGVNAQEQTLCRNSFLYPELLKYKKNYYRLNQKNPHNFFYSPAFIFGQNIKILRDETEKSYLSKECLVDVLSIAAPDVKAMRKHGLQVKKDEIEKDLEVKVKQILRQFKLSGDTILIMGAFGCGSFGNDPQLVARIFKKQLYTGEFAGCFSDTFFSIYNDPVSLAAFSAVFAKKSITN
ncbi:TIGR02452 family protein [Liquorilactobacillus oeni]|uniref:Microbial-type PARG catalytic domain-containing protein n=1 Tax=Liquorilactobacillus oeni DSM 19972 TaxID=1423777 RepID=A0A0R1MDQ2_9LACO|nr:TIGR02452 family protein [Liquorilactobacillus oeni]KRL06223.1 hypothetical protein FD46_GL000224 [Liquorilactobacillus oeni DSM 19972]